jgi:hypothetical protein
VLRVRGGYRQAWRPISDVPQISELAALDQDEDLTLVDDDAWARRILPRLEALAPVLFPDGDASRGRDYSGAAKLMHQKRDWLPVLDNVVREVLDMPDETGRTSVEQRRRRWLTRTAVVRQQIRRNREALQDYQERLRTDELGIGRPIVLSTARILDIVLWSVGRR